MKKLSIDGHYFKDSNNKPFFYTADTAWEMYHKLDEKEAMFYLKNRAKKGFNVIQSVVLAELNGLVVPNSNGDVPFSNIDELIPNENYFDHVISLTKIANNLGLYMVVLPTWGCYWYSGKDAFGDPKLNKQNSFRYGKYLSNKLEGLDIIWMIGGDRSVQSKDDYDTNEQMAKGIKAGKSGDKLMTFHGPGGVDTKEELKNPDWLEFITHQTGHCGLFHPLWKKIEKDFNDPNIKPVLDSEPCYEGHPVMRDDSWEIANTAGRFTDYEVRRASYWSVFAGAAGITYGNYSIWQFRDDEKDEKSTYPSAVSGYKGDISPSWHELIDQPASYQIPKIKLLLDSLYKSSLRVPDKSLIVSNNAPYQNHCLALKSTLDAWIAIYIPTQQSIKIDISSVQNDCVVSWFDPRIGFKIDIPNPLIFENHLSITTPSPGEDWVLIVEKNMKED